MQETMSAPLSARAAAARCGLSERTLRRWIAAGLLRADKQGGAFLVSLEDVRILALKRRGQAAETAAAEDMSAIPHTELSDVADNPAADTTQHDADSADNLAGVVALAELVTRLHDEVSTAKNEAREYAVTAAMWQERAGTLADRLAVAESKLLALTAPQQSQAASGAPDPPDPSTEPAPEPSPWPWPIPPHPNVRAVAPWLLVALVMLLALAWPLLGVPR